MSDNIFESATFGDIYITVGGSILIYHHKPSHGNYHLLIPQNKLVGLRYNDDGTTSEGETMRVVRKKEITYNLNGVLECADHYLETTCLNDSSIQKAKLKKAFMCGFAECVMMVNKRKIAILKKT